MPGRTFLGTNILVYAQDAAAPAKRQKSRDIIKEISETVDGVISI